MTKPDAIEIIRRSELNRDTDELVASLRAGIRIRLDDTAIPRDGGSRFGGLPALSQTLSWPTWDPAPYLESKIESILQRFARAGKPVPDYQERHITKLRELKGLSPLPLAFLGQIDLAELPPSSLNNALPSEGMLWFFFDAFKQPWGFDPLSFGAWRSIYAPIAPLEICASPPSLPARMLREPKSLVFDAEWTLPPVLRLSDERVLTRKDNANYDALCNNLSSSTPPVHRLCGWPQESPDDMRLELQLVSNGIFCGDPSALTHPRRAELERGIADWTPLLQLDSDPRARLCFGDMGKLMFWCKSAEMARGDLSRAWIAVQSH